MQDNDEREMSGQEALARYWRLLLEEAKAAEQKRSTGQSSSPSKAMETEEQPQTQERTAAIRSEPEGNLPSPPNSAKHSPLRQELKQELLEMGMSEEDAEEYLRMI